MLLMLDSDSGTLPSLNAAQLGLLEEHANKAVLDRERWRVEIRSLSFANSRAECQTRKT